jgi:cobalt-zinc-cadmium efflux system outer membrane protein
MDMTCHRQLVLRSGYGPTLAYCIAALLCLCGCQAYRPVALDETAVEQSLSLPPAETLRVRAETLKHPIVPPVTLNLRNGVSPDEAAVLSVLLNPSLRSVRDKRGIAAAQLVQVGLLPNPQLSYSSDFPTGGTTTGTVNAFGLGLSWDATELISRSARIEAASKHKVSVDLDVGWQEWQNAQSAKLAVYDLVSLQGQVNFASHSDQRLAENYATVRRAVQEGLMTELNLSAAETASRAAHSTVLSLRKQTAEQRLKLNQLLGLPADANITLEPGITLPSEMKVLAFARLVDGLQERRLDLVALRRGYESQEETVRAAILNQFPRVNIGWNKARDTGNVVTTGFALAIDLPIFNRNQGQIAIERATRQQLFDEYTDRVFRARADIGRLLARVPLINEEIRTAEQTERSGRQLVQTYRRALDEGQADVLSYYTAWNDLTQTQIRILQLKQQLVDTRIALELASGFYTLPDVAVANEVRNRQDTGGQR